MIGIERNLIRKLSPLVSAGVRGSVGSWGGVGVRGSVESWGGVGMSGVSDTSAHIFISAPLSPVYNITNSFQTKTGKSKSVDVDFTCARQFFF